MTDALQTLLRSRIADVPDFPKPGIIFKDITPLLADPEAFGALTRHLAERYRDAGITQLVGIESRGFIFGAALAQEMGIGFTLVRKPGKLPRATRSGQQNRRTLQEVPDCLRLRAEPAPQHAPVRGAKSHERQALATP